MCQFKLLITFSSYKMVGTWVFGYGEFDGRVEKSPRPRGGGGVGGILKHNVAGFEKNEISANRAESWDL